MSAPIVLASGSGIRAHLLRQCRIEFEVKPAQVDEEGLKSALIADGAKPRDLADALAEAKARKVSGKRPEALIIGCDQVLALGQDLLSKPTSPDDARQQLQRMQGTTHHLLSAAVIYQGMQPLWRHVGVVKMTMRPLSDDYLEGYVARNWDSIRQSVGAYKLEEEGARLFSKVDGDYFHVLGIPLLEILTYLAQRGEIET